MRGWGSSRTSGFSPLSPPERRPGRDLHPVLTKKAQKSPVPLGDRAFSKKRGLEDDFAFDLAGDAGGVGLVGVQVDAGGAGGRDAGDDIVKDQRTLGALDGDLDDLLVHDAGGSGVLGDDVEVTLGHHDALGRRDPPAYMRRSP